LDSQANKPSGGYGDSTAKAASLNFRLATEGRWIEGAAITPHHRLIDYLNANSGGFIDLRPGALTVDPGLDDLEIGAATVRVDNVLLGLPVEQGGRSPGSSDPFVKVRKRPVRVRLGVGRFRVVGDLGLPASSKARDFIASPPSMFIALTDAIVTEAGGAQANVRIVVVNALRVDFLAPVE
jgi:hypothetical protein